MLMMLAAWFFKGAADAHEKGPAHMPKGPAEAHDAGCPAPPTRPRVQLMLMMLAARRRPHAQGRS